MSVASRGAYSLSSPSKSNKLPEWEWSSIRRRSKRGKQEEDRRTKKRKTKQKQRKPNKTKRTRVDASKSCYRSYLHSRVTHVFRFNVAPLLFSLCAFLFSLELKEGRTEERTSTVKDRPGELLRQALHKFSAFVCNALAIWKGLFDWASRACHKSFKTARILPS